MTSYNLGANKPLIQRDQNYVLDRKLLSVHSEDRDIKKWPQANRFEILLPEQMLNVQSLRLVQCTFPSKLYTFSDEYQNTKMQFTLQGTPIIFSITIQPGHYSPSQLALELMNRMNDAAGVLTFNVFYDQVREKFWFGNTTTAFELLFALPQTYATTCRNQEPQPNVWGQSVNWGLPYNLGFERANYRSDFSPTGVNFFYVGLPTALPPPAPILHSVQAPLAFQIGGDTCLYMEVDKYNSYDELYPYQESQTPQGNNPYTNNAYNGKVNAAFAKIPLQPRAENGLDSRTFFLHNVVQYDPPIERIARLKFTLRFHDGRLVDFQNYPFDFSIEFNCLRNELAHKFNVRIPAAYILWGKEEKRKRT